MSKSENLSAANWLINFEIQQDCSDLKKIGLLEEEIYGYIDFFIDNYFRIGEGNDFRISMSKMSENPGEMASIRRNKYREL